MPNGRKESAIAEREDISQFVVHLTRDLTDFVEDIPAIDNFVSILKSRRIEARNRHCLYGDAIETMSAKNRRQFNVVCFTEIPLNQIHLLVKHIAGRSVHLKPYGLVFRKKLLISKGAQPAIYINSYDGNQWLREAVDRLSEIALPIKDNKILWRIIPFINAMHEKYDFSWEREWRVRGSFEFDLKDLVCVILPEEKEDKLKRALAKGGIAVISPGWRYEQIVGELSRQQRLTKKIYRTLLEEAKSDEGETK
jgi:hypothetical protein